MLPGEDFFFFSLNAGCVWRDVCVCVCVHLKQFMLKKKYTSSMYRNRRDSVKLSGVWGSSGLDGRCFKSIMFMETSEFQKKRENLYF